MKRFLISMLFVLSSPAQTRSDLTADLAAFHEHYNVFMRDYFGCPKNAVDIAECVPTNAVMNYKEYRASRKAAMKLFGLKEDQ